MLNSLLLRTYLNLVVLRLKNWVDLLRIGHEI
jgi:hypothetical protein